ncbi:LuxR C-terminal-related transcriptional regulator [Streptomyces sp. YGL11-2]|uniref:helix-turn-helix transcriptional regulator n=1 Tax=Streptomyces sp. YGL11-2 TaxID=3414028 RepID=UPI003CEAD9E6
MSDFGANCKHVKGEAVMNTLSGGLGNSYPGSGDGEMLPRCDASLGELFAEQAARTPHIAAVVDEDSGTFLSYAEVDRISDGIADALRAKRGRASEWVSLANESSMGKLLDLLGVLKAGISVPARYVTIILWIGELVTSGHPKTLLLNKGVTLESSEYTPACSASEEHGREADRRSPRSDAPRAVRLPHVNVVDSVSCSQHIERAAPAGAVDPKSRVRHLEGGHMATPVNLGQLAGPISAPRSQGPTFPTHSPSALLQSPRRTPVLVPVSDETDAQLEDRAIVPPYATVPAKICDLTRAETVVARLVAEGMTNKEIADLLVLSVHTVGTHVRSSFTKLNVTNRVALAREIILHDCAQQSAIGLS